MSRYRTSVGTSYREATNWRDLAACKDYDGELWYADAKDTKSVANARTALFICQQRCPVKAACLADALEVEGNSGRAYRHGLRGGLSAGERAALWRREQREVGA